MAGLLAPFPAEWRRTVAFDNGTEFARHYQLHELGVETFFCDVRSPWQKGGVENRIGRLRRFLPRRTDLSALPDLNHFTQLPPTMTFPWLRPVMMVPTTTAVKIERRSIGQCLKAHRAHFMTEPPVRLSKAKPQRCRAVRPQSTQVAASTGIAGVCAGVAAWIGANRSSGA